MTKLNIHLEAQAEEAESQGLVKIAAHLHQALGALELDQQLGVNIDSREVRDQWVEANLWDSLVTNARFYDKTFDAQRAQEIVEVYAKALNDEFRKMAGVETDIGPREALLPGEEVSV